MRRANLFWGILLVTLGMLFLLNTLGILTINVWGLIWPAVLIAIGLSVLWNTLARPGRDEGETVAIPLDGAAQADVRVAYGAGALKITGLDDPALLLSGAFAGGLDHREERQGEALKTRLQPSQPDWRAFPCLWGGFRRDWSFGLNNRVPLRLDVEAGASRARLDLSSLRVTELRLRVGASSVDVTLPAAAGFTRVQVSAGAASVVLRVPQGVAARIEFQGGAASFEADPARYPRAGAVCQSPDFDTAANKIDLQIEGGAGSFDVR